MILEAIINLITVLVKLLAIPFNVLPDTPPELVEVVDKYMDMIFGNLDFISFFVNTQTLHKVAVIAIAIWTLDKAFSLLMFIIHKLPLSID